MAAFKTFSRFIFGARDPSPSGYSEFMWLAAWIVISVVLVTYVSYLYFGSVNAAYFGEPEPVVVLDVLRKEGEHHLSGDIPVPSSCHGLTVIPHKIEETHYQLVFTTWQEPALSCESSGTVRAFSTIVFASNTGITFSATLDGAELPIHISKRY